MSIQVHCRVPLVVVVEVENGEPEGPVMTPRRIDDLDRWARDVP